VLCLLAIGGSIGWGYEYFQLKKMQSALEHDIKEMERKAALLQRKYAEKRALADQLARIKFALEGQRSQLLAEKETLEKEKGEALSTIEKLQEDLEKGKHRNASLDERTKELSQKLKDANKRYQDLEKKHDQAIKEHESVLKELAEERKDYQRALQKLKGSLERCQTNNAKLCLIADELLDKYQQKGVTDSIMQKEPFTQIKRVQLEHFREEYRERIDAVRVTQDPGKTQEANK
jgi:chromosome segregation ATPase